MGLSGDNMSGLTFRCCQTYGGKFAAGRGEDLELFVAKEVEIA